MKNAHLDISLVYLLISAIFGCFTLFFWNIFLRYPNTYRSLKLRRRTRMLFLATLTITAIFLMLGLYFFLI